MKFTTKTHLSILIAALALSQACAKVTEQDCEDNTRRCNDNIIETCVNGYWNFTSACNADTCTIDAQGNPFCKPADPTNNCLSKCTDGILFLCQDDGSTLTENCLNKNMICGILDDGTPACVDKAQTCQSICKDGFLSICHDDGSVSTQNCANQNMICGILDDGTLTCVDKTQTCQTTCKNNILSHCHDDGSITTENCKLSDKICGLDASGTPTCITNTQSKQCDLNGTAMQIGQQLCDADGNIATCLDDGSIQSTPCERGICVQNECAARACDDIEDGQNICKDNKLMVCDDGSLKEADHGCAQNTTCRDGQNQCSPYNKCGSIAHNATGCLDGNVVTCNDGTTSLLTNCVSKDQFCAPNPETENGFYCKSPDPTDCEWNGGLVEKDKTICDGNLLRTCSALINTEFDEGTDCIELDPNKPICDTNICREEKNCGAESDIEPGAIVCNEDETNKAECVDGTLVDLTDDDACSARENAHSICTFTTEAICSDACNAGFTDVNGTCETIKTCDAVKEKYSETTNTCACNTANHWTGTAGSCTCATNYVLIGNTCELKKTCDATKETYNSSTNTCTCNTANHWFGTAGSCTCDTNYFLENGECVSKKTCNINEVYNADTNTCSCAPNTQWNSDTNTCVCKTGFYQNGNTCSPDNAQHCRGIDCTAVSYWGDGICTAEGKCQVTSCTGDYHLYDNGTAKTCEANSINHCGNHNTQCDPAGSCENGTCICADDKTFCNGVCTNLQTNIDHCGTCGNACAYGLSCIHGKCLGNTNCGGVSYNTATSLDHCGACNHRCSDGTTCIDGECVAGNGPAYCGSQTVQLNTPEHCESCAPCADGLICQNNQCVSGQGKMICNHIVVNSKSDSANCGSCGNVCQAGFKCVNSTCERITNMSTATITCNAKTVKPYTDHDNCGGCGIACSDTSYCKAGFCTTLQVGDIITFGHYEQDNNTTNGKEPITWRVLDKNADGQYLVISDKALEVQPYNTTFISNTWEESTIRSWLNGYDASNNTVGTSFTSDNFIDAAFTNEEKAKIKSSYVPAHATPNYGTPPGNATTDKIFLLSITEAQQYFTSDADRQTDATRYAVKKGAFVYGSETGKYTKMAHAQMFIVHPTGGSARRAAAVTTLRTSSVTVPSALVASKPIIIMTSRFVPLYG